MHSWKDYKYTDFKNNSWIKDWELFTLRVKKNIFLMVIAMFQLKKNTDYVNKMNASFEDGFHILPLLPLNTCNDYIKKIHWKWISQVNTKKQNIFAKLIEKINIHNNS